MSLIELLKKAWKDARDSKYNSLNEYDKEIGYKKSNLYITKDEYFEKEVFEKLSKVYGCGLKKILVDLYIPNTNPLLDNAQLDIVFINRSGIYVIEAKNYSCIVRGKDTDKNWVRIEFNRRKNECVNPVKQNTNHIKNLKKLFPSYENEYFKNIIVFADTCKVRYESNTSLPYETKVINFSEVKSVITYMSKNSKVVFDEDNIYKIYNQLSQYARCSNEIRKNHIQQINKLQK